MGKFHLGIDIVRLDDWEGLYVDGQLFYEGHEIGYDRLLTCIENNNDYEFTMYHAVHWLSKEQEAKIQDLGNLPKTLLELGIEES